ncbi:hypothetical protein [Paenibacillus lactis]|uniref:hypothetical protein n=1 Tax=Paenibacillus lactis TaxID=228574 RepID=UPI003D7424DB
MSILIIFLIILIVVLVLMIISWAVHISMTSDGSNKSGWADYSTFRRWFDSYEWETDNDFKGSLWNRKMNCKYHAGIIKFEGIGMKINNPLSYLLVASYVWRYTKRMGKGCFVNFKHMRISNKAEKKGYNVHLPSGDTVYVSLEEIYGRNLE